MPKRGIFWRSPTGKTSQWVQRAALLILAILTGHFALAAGLCVFINSQPTHERFSLFDAALIPFRWEVFRKAQGRRNIEDGLRLLRENDWNQAVAHLRAGLARCPESRDARLALVRIYIKAGRRTLAKSTLLDGLPYARHNVAYCRETLGFLLDSEDDASVIALAETELSKPNISFETANVFRLAAATAAFFRGHYDEAEHWLAHPSLEGSTPARLLLVRIAWETGYKDLAVHTLNQMTSESEAGEEVYDLLVHYLRERRDYSTVRGLSLARQLADPTSIRPRLDYLYACEQSGDSQRAEWEINALLREFAADAKAAAALGEYAAETANRDLARALAARVQAPDPAFHAVRLALIETLISARDFKSALDELNRPTPHDADLPAALRHGLQAAAYAGLNDPAASRLHLAAFLATPNLRAETVVAIADHLQRAGSPDSAREALESALRVDPLNQKALIRLVEIDLVRPDLPALAEHVRAYTQTRNPAHALIVAAREKLAADGFLFSAPRNSILELLRRASDGPQRLRRSI